MDKMTIMGEDGKAKYELGPDNTVKDVKDYCKCTDSGRPEQRDGNVRICLICNLEIPNGSDSV